eukprot:PhF_6_TR41482/c0_g1_i1/m.62882
MNTLLPWARSLPSMYVHKSLVIQKTPTKGYGLHVITAIPPFTPLLVIPMKYWYSSQRLRSVYNTTDAARDLALKLQDASADTLHPMHTHASFIKTLPVPNNLDIPLETIDAQRQQAVYKDLVDSGKVELWSMSHAMCRAHYSKDAVKVIPIMDLINHAQPDEGANSMYKLEMTSSSKQRSDVFLVHVAGPKGISVDEEVLYTYSPCNREVAADRDRWK